MTNQNLNNNMPFFRKVYLVSFPIIIIIICIFYTEIRIANQSHSYPVLQEKINSQNKEIVHLEKEMDKLKKDNEQVKKVLEKIYQYQNADDQSKSSQIGEVIGDLLKGLLL